MDVEDKIFLGHDFYGRFISLATQLELGMPTVRSGIYPERVLNMAVK